MRRRHSLGGREPGDRAVLLLGRRRQLTNHLLGPLAGALAGQALQEVQAESGQSGDQLGSPEVRVLGQAPQEGALHLRSQILVGLEDPVLEVTEQPAHAGEAGEQRRGQIDGGDGGQRLPKPLQAEVVQAAVGKRQVGVGEEQRDAGRAGGERRDHGRLGSRRAGRRHAGGEVRHDRLDGHEGLRRHVALQQRLTLSFRRVESLSAHRPDLLQHGSGRSRETGRRGILRWSRIRRSREGSTGGPAV